MPKGKETMTPSQLNNLKKGAPQFDSQTGAAAGKKGGKATAEKRRQQKTMRELAQTIASSEITSKKARKSMEALGIDPDDATNQALVVHGVFKKAIAGDMPAVEKWESMTETLSTAEQDHYELPARIIGKAFVDINRHIEPNYEYWFNGGRGGLKSTYIGEKVIELLKNNPQMHAVVIRKVGLTLRDSVFDQLVWTIGELGLDDEFKVTKSPLAITLKSTGQRIYFRGLDDKGKLKSLKPPFGYCGILWFEEADQFASIEELRNVTQSILRGGEETYLFVSYNPPRSISNWINQEVRQLNDKRIVHTSCYLDVPPEWLGTKFLEDAEYIKETNPAAYEHEYLGIPNGEGGLVFERATAERITDEQIEAFDRIYQGVDWGYNPDPYAFVRLHYDHAHDTIYLIDEYYVKKKQNRTTAKWILDKGYKDTWITCDSSEQKSVADYVSHGLPARAAAKGPGSVDYSMKWLAGKKIVIDPGRTPHAWEEFSKYELDRDKDGNVIAGYPDKNNHIIDAVRYALECVWRSTWSPD